MAVTNGILTWPASGPTLTIVTSVFANGTPTTVTTASVNTTGANLFVMVLAAFTAAAATPTVSDSAGNTFTLVRYDIDDVSPNLTGTAIYYCFSPITAVSHTFTCSNGFTSIGVWAISGSTASPLDQQNGHITSGQSSIQPGSITPSSNGTFVAFVVQNFLAGSAPTTPAGYSVLNSSALVPGSTYAYLFCSQLQLTAAATNPTSNLAAESFQECSIANFK